MSSMRPLDTVSGRSKPEADADTDDAPVPPRGGRAMPKSVTRTRPSTPTSTLSGLKSRCTSPASWAACRPRPAATNVSTTSGQARGCSRCHAVSVWPSTSSMAKNTRPSNVPTSCTVITLGWLSCAMACASRSSRWLRRRPAASSLPSCSTLSAILRSSSGS
jgi:hypothetical protein